MTSAEAAPIRATVATATSAVRLNQDVMDASPLLLSIGFLISTGAKAWPCYICGPVTPLCPASIVVSSENRSRRPAGERRALLKAHLCPQRQHPKEVATCCGFVQL